MCIVDPAPNLGPAPISQSHGLKNGVQDGGDQTQKYTHKMTVWLILWHFMLISWHECKEIQVVRVFPTMSSIRGHRWCRHSTERCLQDSHLPFCLFCNFVCISTLKKHWDQSLRQNFDDMAKNSIMSTFGKSCGRPWLHGNVLIKVFRASLLWTSGSWNVLVQMKCSPVQIFRNYCRPPPQSQGFLFASAIGHSLTKYLYVRPQWCKQDKMSWIKNDISLLFRNWFRNCSTIQ